MELVYLKMAKLWRTLCGFEEHGGRLVRIMAEPGGYV